ncbi:M23 family metallopeptidase [Pseudothermotoga thermarum]|uniref:Peptidase M23 n=1 Tax=Pseudothermotoga thermarum DSM 5069 TaxID=688269 RepID=F7YXR7_9THEM|nr:M23 family metallopeptidase [Pseudothermotoga thermarum]AEH50711.1 Peptidase M23 [Pseudothermotoga thermarum DSM 5069]
MKKIFLMGLLVVAVLSFGTSFFIYPVEIGPILTASFGEFRGTGNRGPHFHMGIDLSTNMRSGVPILAAADGWLVRVEIDEDDIYGNVIVLEHENGYRTLYAHLSDFSSKVQDIVRSVVNEFGKRRIVVEFPEKTIFFKVGEVIGFSGRTGEAAQPHCHFEVRSLDESVCYDPMDFLPLVIPSDARFEVRSLIIDGERYTYSPGRVYLFKGDIPKIAINAVTVSGRNVLGLKRIRLYFDGTLAYELDFSTIPWNEFNNVWAIYTRDSVSDGYTYSAWYKLYPELGSSLVKVNRFAEIARLPKQSRVKITLTDVWNRNFDVEFLVERR